MTQTHATTRASPTTLMQVKPDPANPGQVAVAVADSNGATPEAPAAPDTAPAKSTLYPPVPPAGAIPP